MFYNNIKRKKYIGSSVNLDRRLRAHIFVYKSSNLPLYRAIIKYGLDNLTYLILKYCEADYEKVIALEQNYIDFYDPEYNLLKIAGSSHGFKHKPETILKLQIKHSGKNHPRFGTNYSQEQRDLTSLNIKEFYKTHTHPTKGKKGALSPQYRIGGKSVHCYDSQNNYNYFPSINGARQHFKVRFTKISDIIDKGKFVSIKDTN
jgi:group I intron endonuclease